MKYAFIILGICVAAASAYDGAAPNRHRHAPGQSDIPDTVKMKLMDSLWTACQISQDPQKLPAPSKKWFVCKSCGDPRNSPVVCRTVLKF